MFIFFVLLGSASLTQRILYSEINQNQTTYNLTYDTIGFKRKFVQETQIKDNTLLNQRYDFKLTEQEEIALDLVPTKIFHNPIPIKLVANYNLLKTPPSSNIGPLVLGKEVNFPIKHLNTENGLFSNHCTALAYKSDGTIWIGHNQGQLSIIKGNKLTYFKKQHGLSENAITGIIEFKNFMLILTFGNGLYAIQNNTILHLTKENGLPSDHLLKAKKDAEGNIWIATFESGLIKIDHQGNHLHFPLIDSSQKIAGLEIDEKDNKIYLNTQNNGVIILDQMKQAWQINLPEKYGNLELLDIVIGNYPTFLMTNNILFEKLPNQIRVSQIETSARLSIAYGATSKNIWLGSKSGDLILFNKGFQSKISTENGLINGEVSSFITDRFKNLWVATYNNGINIIQAKNFRSILTTRDDLIGEESIVANETNHSIFVSTKKGLARINSSNRIQEILLPMNIIGKITGISALDSTIWISSLKGLFEITGNKLFSYQLPEDDPGLNTNLGINTISKDTVLVSNYNYAVLIFDLKNKVVHKPNFLDDFSSGYSTFKDSKNRLWIGSRHGGMAYLKDNQLISISKEIGTIHNYCEDDKGIVYIGSNTGLYCFKEDGLFKQRIPIIHNPVEVQSISYFARDSSLWLGCTKNLIRVNLKDSTFIEYGPSDGIVGSSFNRNSIATMGENLYWGNNKAIVQYIRFDFQKIKSKPTLFMEDIFLDNQRINLKSSKPTTSISLNDLSENQMNFELSNDVKTIGFELNTDEITDKDFFIFYKTETDKFWKGPLESNRVDVPITKNGNHTITFSGQNSDLIWTNDFIVNYTVVAPLYENNIFIITILLMVLAAILLVMIKRSKFNIGVSRNISELALFLSRTRFIALAGAIILPAAEIVFGLKYKLYPHNFTGFAIISVLTTGYLIISYLKGVSRQLLQILAFALTIGITLFLYLRIIQTDAAVIPLIQLSMTIVFCSLLFERLGYYMVYLTTIFLAFIVSLIWVDNSQSNYLYLVYLNSLAILFSFIYQYFQVFKSTNHNFSSFLLERYESFVVVVNKKGEIIYLNNFGKTLLNVDETTMMDKKWFELGILSLNQTKITKFYFDKIFNQQITPEKTKIYVRKLKRYIQFDFQLMEDGTLLCIGNDISELKEKDDRLNTLYTAMTIMNSGVIITDATSKIEWCNAHFANMFGYLESELKGKRPKEFFQIHPDFIEQYTEMIADPGYRLRPFEVAHITKSGETIWLTVHTTELKNRKGEVTNIIQVINDITELKQKEKELQQLSLISEATQSPIVLTDKKLNIQWGNKSVTEQFGFLDEDYLGKTPQTVFVGEETEQKHVDLINDLLYKKEPFAVSIQLRNKTGAHHWYKLIVDPVFDNFNKIYQFMCILQPIQELIDVQNELKERNQDIIDGISYTKLIQDNQMPPIKDITNIINDTFIYYSPKDIVSGDFYFFKKIDEKILLAAVDCTGHGVPGAMMTFIGMSGMERAVEVENLTEPKEILAYLDDYVKKRLSAKADDIIAGMDTALICINLKTKELKFSGAKRPLLIFDENRNESDLIWGSKKSIGEFYGDEKVNTYEQIKIPLSINQHFFLFSDGITDQFGWDEEKNTLKKFGLVRLKNFISETHSLSKIEQNFLLNSKLKDWTKNFEIEQTDDIVVIGFKISEI